MPVAVARAHRRGAGSILRQDCASPREQEDAMSRIASLATFVVILPAVFGSSVPRAEAGDVWGAGSNSSYGELGDGYPHVNHPTPILLPALSGATAIAAGNYHSISLKTNGTVWDCGSNSQGQLGNGSTTNSY